MKILALDLGDRWIGTALSDVSGILARPYKTVERDHLVDFLTALFKEQTIVEVIIGNPKTLKGTDSQQTQKIAVDKKDLEEQFPDITWILWDERLSSKHAQNMRITKDKIEIHSIAAALILDSYLTYKLFQRDMGTD